MTTTVAKFSGLASGIDTAGIITQLTAVAQKPITLLQGKDDGYNGQLASWQQFNTALSALQSAAASLNTPATFSAATATSSNPAVAAITTLPGAAIGDHTLSVTRLASAQKVVSGSVSSGSTALGRAGSFTLNGKTVTVRSTDALTDISVKINAAKAGVSATVVNVGAGDFRLTLTSNQTGAANTIAASDTSGDILSGLGVLGGGAAAIRQAVRTGGASGGPQAAGAASLTLGSATVAVGTLLGIAAGSAPAGSFQISNGAGASATVPPAGGTLDLNTASLSDVANAINQAGVPGVSAEVVTLPDLNGNLYRINQLQITNTNAGPATPSTATAAGGSLQASDTFSGALTVNGQSLALTGNTTTLAQLNTALQATPGNAGVTATVSGGALVLTDPSGNPISATTTGLHNWTGGTADQGALGAATVANGSPSAPIPPTFTDTDGLLGTLGVLQKSFSLPVASAQDAKFNLDGLDVTRSSNTVSDVIPGATIKLLSGTAAAPGITDLSVTQNTDAIVQSVSAFAGAYNAIQDFVAAQNKFSAPTDAKSGAAGSNAPLFGDTTLNQTQDQLSQALSAVSGKTTLESIGVSLDQHGHLNVDPAALTSALQADPQSVAGLFSTSGATDSGDIQFVAAGPKTAATSGAGYAVAVTQPATQSGGAAGTAGTGPSGTPETLTFAGALLPAGVKLTLPAGSTLADTARLINNTSSLSSQVYARVDGGGHLVISSNRYGSGTGFSVSSDLAASGTNSGIGPSLSVLAGVDVVGTINGEPATGVGRTLTGNAGNAHTEGLQLLVTATAASPAGGATGHAAVTQGVADSLGRTLAQILDPVNGAVIGAEHSLNLQISDTQDQIQKIQDQVSTYKDYLTQMFSQMESRVSALQAQGAAFAAQVGASTNSNGSSKL